MFKISNLTVYNNGDTLRLSRGVERDYRTYCVSPYAKRDMGTRNIYGRDGKNVNCASEVACGDEYIYVKNNTP
jgi:hypothetical protein